MHVQMLSALIEEVVTFVSLKINKSFRVSTNL